MQKLYGKWPNGNRRRELARGRKVEQSVIAYWAQVAGASDLMLVTFRDGEPVEVINNPEKAFDNMVNVG